MRLLGVEQRTSQSKALESRLSSASADVSDRRQLALEMTERHRYDEAIRLLLAELTDTPTDFTLWFSLGNAYLNAQNFTEAEECFTSAIALKPGFTLGLQHRGFARLNTGKFAAARADLDQVLLVWPQNTSSRLNRALACEALGFLEDAESDLTQALLDGCNETRVYFLRGQIRERRGDD